MNEREGGDAAEGLARELAEQPKTSAGLLVEVAKFHYLLNRTSLGDGYIERAKETDPRLLRIYDEEAWNQRARGNLHRELQAVQHAIDVAPDVPSRFYWQVWLGEILVRQDRFDEAWQHLGCFPEFATDDPALLSAGYCAHMLGLDAESMAAYRRFAPEGPDGYDAVKVAHSQFTLFQRATEAARLLEPVSSTAPTKALELSAEVQLRLGNPERSAVELGLAASRTDRSTEVRPKLAQLLELLERPSEAIHAYESLTATESSAFLRFRAGELLVAQGRTMEAVTRFLADVSAEGLPPLADVDVDPALPSLIAQTRDAALDDFGALFPEILQRASSEALIFAASLASAAAHARGQEWDAAWAAIRLGQTNRLPSVSLTDGSWENSDSQRATHYAEWIETEPIAPDITLYESSLGATTSCNPLAICLELLNNPAHASRVHVWSIEPGASIHPELLNRANVRFVAKQSPGYFRALAVAGTIINNATIDHEFMKRPGQRYLNTWHGVPWKHMGRDNRSEPFAYGNIARNFLHADVVLGPDPHTLDVLSRGHDVDELIPGVFVRAGYPRNDLTLNLSSGRRDHIRTALGVRETDNLVVLLPTWKGTFADRNSEVDQVIAVARGLLDSGAKVAVRAHHYVSAAFRNTEILGVKLVPDEFDTNELLGAANAIVTDFSSVLFDAAATGVPVVKLVADIEQYAADRGLYFSAEEVPGANAATIPEAARLVAAACADPTTFTAQYAEQTARFSATEVGSSARHAISLLFDDSSHNSAPRPEPAKSVLLSTGGLPPNGITRSTRSLIASLQGTEYTPYLIPGKNTLEGADPETLRDVRRYAKVLPRVGTIAGTRMERETLYFGTGRNYVPSPMVQRFLDSGARREAMRLFGDTNFHAAVEFSAYDAKNITLLNYGVHVGAGRRGIVFHNEMWQEVQNRFPRLRSGFYSLDRMDFLASVSDDVRDYNARTMHEHFGIATDRHITIENTINVAEIRELASTPLDQEDHEWYEADVAHACIVARLSPEKNHEQFFDALASCRRDLSRPVRITCLGDGPLRMKLERQLRDLGLTDIVRLRGLVPNPQAHLKAAGAMILPSLHEGQPLVILEALTVGAAVVATDTHGSRSVLHYGAFGQLVPISKPGLVSALHRVADGTLDGTATFDAEEFTTHSRDMFLDAIDPDRTR
ncbi:CDP-glycerol: N-acetyl-beta-D-mannosaminyl-1,4-N-acetyl-D-glucosaminyldiphosphoundecaprenyl glycerophosphotransferase [Leucobacter sp. 7(1)]|uniref:CDP-glycerol glycerophosphotransferase family protein n=1 Tax=Leucobacter sp. 7(1) TaxID=1255613 RepID=UPI00097EA07C|nr:CDP-glycerol glycerophosphotransferase family protein [Leucobacter sp. 7(1)]SJN13370.1 CDP-glycerol: N-acetyl-beta-D-mannosaminyl-1,4-N-acetyl-D-glucosaminyldiphosphoundecaprenyl glycerophosphotransferase [Leucobacter sp. 7(1)]